MDLEEEWESFCIDENNTSTIEYKEEQLSKEEIPKCSDIYISTKTNIIYLSNNIDLKKCFWKIPIIDYYLPIEGVLKKQIKYNLLDKDEYSTINENLKHEKIVENYSISKNKTNNKFEDVRKISVGLCKKDIVSHKKKKKSAFYNCFVLIIRLKIEDQFKEAHVKVFNTGKLEIPGIQNDEFMWNVINKLLHILNSSCSLNVTIMKDTCDTVLINSNFKCGYFINREKLFDLLKYKYKLHTSYDPCSYPGIMNKFWYNHGEKEQTGLQKSKNACNVSFMIFRTGSVLIVGKCNEKILNVIYTFLKKIFHEEYHNIYHETPIEMEKQNKIKRKKYTTITVSK